MIGAVGVIVPAHDEAQNIDRCLAAIAASRVVLCAEHPQLEVRCVVAVDRCSDATPSLVDTWAASCEWLVAVRMEHANVGAARRGAVERVAELLTLACAGDVWLASTDADSAVPESWLLDHVTAADAGADVLLGGVDPDFSDSDRVLHSRWRAHQRRSAPNIHGANLGIRLSAYRDAGGFDEIREHEDVRLVERLVSGGARTAVRMTGRTPGGLAGLLRTLAGDAG
jgi:glycosyltransferase involved in cell wall biosynthesis